MILVALLYLLFSLSYFAIQQSLLYAPPLFIVGVRLLCAGLFTLGFLALKKRAAFSLKKKDLWLFGAFAVCGMCIANVCEVLSLQWASPAYLTLLYTSAPFIAALLAYIFWRERLSRAQWLGLGIGIGGIMPVVLAPVLAGCAHVWFADVTILSVILAGMFGWCTVKILVAQRGYNPFFVVGLGMTLGGAGTLLLSWSLHGIPIVAGMGWVYILISTFLANVCAYNLYGYLLTSTSLVFISFASILSPLFAAGWEWLFWQTKPSALLFMSLLVVALGLGIFYRQELMRKK